MFFVFRSAAALLLLDNARRHRLRRSAQQLPARRSCHGAKRFLRKPLAFTQFEGSSNLIHLGLCMLIPVGMSFLARTRLRYSQHAELPAGSEWYTNDSQ
jgi:hypothetical protein